MATGRRPEIIVWVAAAPLKIARIIASLAVCFWQLIAAVSDIQRFCKNAGSLTLNSAP